ncbi:MAG: restriction endonuclease [Pseudomonadales bacterium]
MVKPGSSLEKDVQWVYSYLLNMKDEGVIVGNSVRMVGKSGLAHEIDVYYEFARAGIRHRVAIECKDWKSAVSKGQVQEFESKLRDIGSITGVMVSRHGYQSGADAFARHHDILTLRFDELPSFGTILAQRLTAVALPDESYLGEPFWVLMELRNGKATGSHFAPLNAEGKPRIPLLLSKYHAERLLGMLELDPTRWGARGLPRFALRAFLLTLEVFEKRADGAAELLFLPPDALPDAKFIAIPMSREALRREYYGGEIPSIEEAVNRRQESGDTQQ